MARLTVNQLEVPVDALTRDYKVKQVRGPLVRLPAHPDHCSDEQELAKHVTALRTARPSVRLVADLFSGAGGMSLGLQQAGFEVVFSADHNAEAVETHAHHFPGMAVDWDLGDPGNIERVAEIIRSLDIDVLAGGPPCQPFSKAGRSGIRHRVRNGLRDPHDQRRDLWRSYLEVVRLAMPRAVVMENVPDMALDKEMFILRAIVEDLEQLGYAVQERVVDCPEYGIPQFRQRLILVALRNGHSFQWPEVAGAPVTVWNAIGEMPEVAGGWRPEGGAQGWTPYEGPSTAYQRLMRVGVPASESNRLYDHITRPVREDDAVAFDHMDHETRYSQLPQIAQRYRTDIFDDKYKRLDENYLSRTITAHIAKDGYWYIHPRQGRTLTVREAARLQSFPDHYRFAGTPSAAFRQIGNAVPPLLARQLGESVFAQLDGPDRAAATSRETATLISSWFGARTQLNVPWLRAETAWQVIAGEILLDRLSGDAARLTWSVLGRHRTAQEAVEAAAELVEIATWVGRQDRVPELLNTAQSIVDTDRGHGDGGQALGGPAGPAAVELPERVADLVALVVPAAAVDGEEPILINKGVLRLARRFYGDEQMLDRQNKRTDGRLAIARLVGGGATARDAHLGLIEIAASMCGTGRPRCGDCPLVALCHTGSAGGRVR